MALKNERYWSADDISFFMNEVAERGGVVTISTAGSGAAQDQGSALVTYAASQSGKVPVGVLMQDMVDKDLTQTHLNYYKDEVQKGGKVDLWTAGWVVTNMIYPGLTPTAGATAYMGPSGLLQTTNVNSVASPVVGKFLSTKDADGYAKFSFNLQ
jgi:hypothetical protein